MQEKGTGFGMPIVKKYMELYGGQIQMQSRSIDEFPQDCWRLKMVAAQVDPTVSAAERWLDRSYSAWTAFYDGVREEAEGAGPALEPPVVFDRRDQDAPHFPLQISFDPRIRGIDLINPQQRPDWQFIQTAFGPFLAGATARLLPDVES
jgi:hypothetical protein